MVRKLLFVTLPALAIVGLVLAAAVEVWVRASWNEKKGVPGFFLSDPRRGQRLAANYSGWFAGVPVHINRLELRDPREYALEKGPRTFRILVLGDSVTFGHGAVYEHTYPYLLEQRLKAWRPGVDWQVWNAAVPGYNTSQELAQLLEVGPAFKPNLVVVGFFENDLIDNRPAAAPPGAAIRTGYRLMSFARRHIYSLELYKRVALALAWRLSASSDYHRRLEHLDTEESLIAASDQSAAAAQQLTPFEWRGDEWVRGATCVYGMKPNPSVVPSMRRDPGFDRWVAAVRGFQDLNRSGAYRIVFFVNMAPPICPDGGSDMFYDGGTSALNAFYLSILGDGTPAVSAYDAFLHARPSQMPFASGHAFGNSNVVKAQVLFDFLATQTQPPAPPR